MIKLSVEELAKRIDQTYLKIVPDSEDEFIKFLLNAKKYRFASVAIYPAMIPLAREILKGTGVKITAAIGFPLGTVPIELKVLEVERAIKDGADEVEIDFVLNKGALKSGKIDEVREELKKIVEAAKGRIVKAIIEVPYLTKEEIKIACELAIEAGVHYIKTSTGFKGFHKWRPTTAEDVRFIKSIVGNRVKIKAAGGIRTAKQALEVIEAGADRIGTSSGVEIIEEYKKMMEGER